MGMIQWIAVFSLEAESLPQPTLDLKQFLPLWIKTFEGV